METENGTVPGEDEGEDKVPEKDEEEVQRYNKALAEAKATLRIQNELYIRQHKVIGIRVNLRSDVQFPFSMRQCHRIPHPTIGQNSQEYRLGHSLIRSLRSLVPLLHPARFARALRCANSFARSLAHSQACGGSE